jgi:hypothetical protein
MNAKKSTAVAVINEEQMNELKDLYPVESGYQPILLPRISFTSQDKTEGKGKAMKVVVEAGTFFQEKQLDTEVDNGEGKMVKEWEKTELGNEIEATILYTRKQLKFYDEGTEQYTSSPVFDSEDEVIPLWCDKKEVAKGTPKELKAKYEYTDKDKKVKSRLEENRILYVLYKGEIHQMNLRGSSMYSFLTWSKKVMPPSLLTKIASESMEKGDISWNKMTFTPVRALNKKELADVIEKVRFIKEGIDSQKSHYASQNEEKKADDDRAEKKFKDF